MLRLAALLLLFYLVYFSELREQITAVLGDINGLVLVHIFAKSFLPDSITV
jgi:hypothetical protein